MLRCPCGATDSFTVNDRVSLRSLSPRIELPAASRARPPMSSRTADAAFWRATARGRLRGRGPLAVALALAAVLVVFAGGYGYHRDELYFLAAGRHLAWGYPDQGPLTPLIAHAMNAIAPDSLTALRIPSALMSGLTVLATSGICLELGGNRRARLIAALCAAVASVVVVVGHLLSTTTFDLFAWAAVSWLIVRALRTGQGLYWIAAGAVAGIALLNKPLIAFLLAAIGAGLLLAGPRRALRSPWPWLGLALALGIWAPWLAWQAEHGWPQLDVSSSIASGGSTSSQPRWELLPFQLLLVSPVLAPVWIAGLIALWREQRLAPYRAFALAWVLLAAVFLATAGKPYYLAGMFPVLLAAGAIPVDRWLRRGSAARVRTLAAALALSGLVSAVIALPVLGERDLGPVLALNADAGETVGWPAFARTVASVARRAGPNAVVFTSNYGEAGAIERFGPALGVPLAYSGHNGFAEWGPPPDRPGAVVAVGLSVTGLARHFRACTLAARISNPAGVENDERGEPVELCAATRAPWSRMWGSLRHLG
jgi:4-amino-4-deoxy-L-arabinose transferase-like glycosyltransferase